ncbi:MAG: hypothetical protein ACE5Q6_15415 [Dehalococcoidia bacterium]
MNEIPHWALYVTEVPDWQVVSSIAAAVAALAASVAAYLTYRSRPLRIRSVEIHSEELKKIITRWIDELKATQSPEEPSQIRDNRSYITASDIPEPDTYQLALEGDILFQDLREHLPGSLFRKWQTYKAEVDSYLRNKRKITCAVLDFVESTSGLRVHDYSGTRPEWESFWFSGVPQLVYQDLASIARGRDPSWFLQGPSGQPTNFEVKNDYELWKGGRAIIYSRLDAAERLELQHFQGEDVFEKAMRLHAGLGEAIQGESALKQTIQEHQQQDNDLNKSREEFVASLRQWASVPILPNECRLLKGKIKALE